MAHASTTASALSADDAPLRRGIHSYVTRRGRMTTGQARALAELGPRYLVPFDPAVTDLAARLSRPAPPPSSAASATTSPSSAALAVPVPPPHTRTILEIGFGMGGATAHIAGLMPDTLFIGCEVHEAGVGALLKLMGELGLGNIRIVQHDAAAVVRQMIAPATLDGIHVFFPDPWHKKRHHKRRLIQPAFTHELAARLKPGGTLHCATDWQPYAEQMLEVLSAEPLLANTAANYAPRPDYRPLTKFELRGLRLGHGVWDLVFRRT